ncbi:fumarate hydratase C-terminal domain-containing protein [Streptomyces sp. ICC4]|nr:fumarate hydratase C-terminal domain-containing protein [Streptomyces sp. ICC4]AWZ09770.1 hypothetical protein DRB89_41210 [Streptomyces sp. ICC4]
MEEVWTDEVEDFPAVIMVDNKGNDFLVGPAQDRAFTHNPVRGPGL